MQPLLGLTWLCVERCSGIEYSVRSRGEIGDFYLRTVFTAQRLFTTADTLTVLQFRNASFTLLENSTPL